MNIDRVLAHHLERDRVGLMFNEFQRATHVRDPTGRRPDRRYDEWVFDVAPAAERAHLLGLFPVGAAELRGKMDSVGVDGEALSPIEQLAASLEATPVQERLEPERQHSSDVEGGSTLPTLKVVTRNLAEQLQTEERAVGGSPPVVPTTPRPIATPPPLDCPILNLEDPGKRREVKTVTKMEDGPTSGSSTVIAELQQLLLENAEWQRSSEAVLSSSNQEVAAASLAPSAKGSVHASGNRSVSNHSSALGGDTPQCSPAQKAYEKRTAAMSLLSPDVNKLRSSSSAAAAGSSGDAAFDSASSHPIPYIVGPTPKADPRSWTCGKCRETTCGQFCHSCGAAGLVLQRMANLSDASPSRSPRW